MLEHQHPPDRITHGVSGVEAGLRRRVERLLREETDRLGRTPETRERLLPPHLLAVIVEVVTRTMLRVEGCALGVGAGHIGVKRQRAGEAPR
jgi:hypothetical protein